MDWVFGMDRIEVCALSTPEILPVFWLFSDAIPEMEQGQDRVPEEHTRAGIAHHDADLLPMFGPVTVHRALGAGGFTLLKGAPVQALQGVLQEFLAFWTKQAFRRVMCLTVEADHRLYCFSFSGHPPARAV